MLIELHAVCTRKLGMDRAAAGEAVRAVALFPVVGADRELMLDAVALADAARREPTAARVRVVNPFA